MAMLMEEDNKDKGVPISFGTTQDRKLFPHHCAFNRLGNLDGIRGETHLGPDKYNVDKVCVMCDVYLSAYDALSRRLFDNLDKNLDKNE